MNCLQNIGKLFAVSVLLAMFAVSYISVERNRNTASEKLADFLYPFQNGKGCSTPSLKLNGSTAQHECRTEGKAAPSFCCSPERQETEMSYTVKTCRWEKHSNPVATPAERNTAEIERNKQGNTLCCIQRHCIVEPMRIQEYIGTI